MAKAAAVRFCSIPAATARVSLPSCADEDYSCGGFVVEFAKVVLHTHTHTSYWLPPPSMQQVLLCTDLDDDLFVYAAAIASALQGEP